MFDTPYNFVKQVPLSPSTLKGPTSVNLPHHFGEGSWGIGDLHLPKFGAIGFVRTAVPNDSTWRLCKLSIKRTRGAYRNGSGI
jgi:hypothetical protein